MMPYNPPHGFFLVFSKLMLQIPIIYKALHNLLPKINLSVPSMTYVFCIPIQYKHIQHHVNHMNVPFKPLLIKTTNILLSSEPFFQSESTMWNGVTSKGVNLFKEKTMIIIVLFNISYRRRMACRRFIC